MLQEYVLVSLTVIFVSLFSFSFMFLFPSTLLMLVSVSVSFRFVFFFLCLFLYFHFASELCILRLVCGQQSKLISQQVLAACAGGQVSGVLAWPVRQAALCADTLITECLLRCDASWQLLGSCLRLVLLELAAHWAVQFARLQTC